MAEPQKPLTPAQQQALQEEKDKQIRKKEEKAPTTRTTMGEGRIGETDYLEFAPKAFFEAGKKAVEPSYPKQQKKAKGGTIRGHGCERRGKTKGKFV